MKIRNDQKGIAHVTMLVLVVVVIGVVGFAGWKVWDNSQNKPKNAENFNSSEAKDQQNLSNKDTAPNTKTNYFEIKEFGVKFELPKTLERLYYHIGNNGRTVYFSLNELKDTECAADRTAQIALSRYTDADYKEDEQAAASKNSAKKIGNYYFNVASGQAMCDSEGSASQEKASAMKVEIVKILPASLMQK